MNRYKIGNCTKHHMSLELHEIQIPDSRWGGSYLTMYGDLYLSV